MNLRPIFYVFLAGFLVSCNSLEIYHRPDGTHYVVAHSRSEGGAYNASLEDATEYCEQQGANMITLKQKSKYQGMDKNMQGALDTAGVIFGRHTYWAAHRGDDYRVHLDFKCVTR